jgi:uncharacterized membrane protein
MADIEQRLSDIESRLVAIERLFNKKPAPTGAPAAPPQATLAATGSSHAAAPSMPRASQPPAARSPAQPSSSASSATPTATVVLGWGGMAALLLAAAYLISLAISAGWLTPVRQVMLTALLGLVLIVAGFGLLNRNPRYASLLPGAGVVVLFLAVYGAHLYHGLIGAVPATAGVIVICLLTLALGRMFEGEFYALFAVIGSYTGPLLLANLQRDPVDLAIYFSAWSVLYCWYSINSGRRGVYLIAAYLAFIVFDLAWRRGPPGDWQVAIAFQFVQLLIFAGATVLFSVIRKEPLETGSATAHIPVLLLFYFVQYTILREHLPAWAPWIAFASLGLLLAAYGIARAVIGVPLAAGRLVIAVYAAVVLLHAGYFELLPSQLRPLCALVLLVVAAAAASRQERPSDWWPLFAAVAVIFVLNYCRLLFGWEVTEVQGYRYLIPLYAIALYLAYWLIQRDPRPAFYRNWPLYMGHINMMAGADKLIDGRFFVSIVWGVLAVATLVIAISLRNRDLGRSALFVFAAFAAKVWFYDLSGSEPLLRVGSLLVLGGSLYVGGLLYQKVDALPKQAP